MARKKSLEDVAIETRAIEEATAEVFNQQVEEETENRDELIAEANRLTGRVEALSMVKKCVTVSELLILKNIKKKKIYKNIRGCETWVKYCKSIGYSERHIDEQLENLSLLGEQFSETVSEFGLGYRELKKLKASAKAGEIKITDNSVVIDGEVISLSDKDELQDALEYIITEKENTIKAQARTIKAKEDLNSELSVQREDARRELEAKKDEIASMLDAKNYSIPAKDKPDFVKLKTLQDKITSIMLDLQTLSDKELSEVNQHLLGGVLLLALKIFEEYRVILNNKEGAYLDRLFMTEEELEASDKMLLPNDLRKK